MHASEVLLERLARPHQEFDRASWLQQAGTCALSLGQYILAEEQLQRALDELPTEWTLRYTLTSLSLAKALTHIKEPEKAIEVARKVLPIIKATQTKVLTQKLMNYLQEDLIVSFPNDKNCRAFIAEVRQQLTLE